jgi:radical SAM superfamily enzyme
LTALVVVQAVAIVQLMRGTEPDTVPDAVVHEETTANAPTWVTSGTASPNRRFASG